VSTDLLVILSFSD